MPWWPQVNLCIACNDTRQTVSIPLQETEWLHMNIWHLFQIHSHFEICIAITQSFSFYLLYLKIIRPSNLVNPRLKKPPAMSSLLAPHCRVCTWSCSRSKAMAINVLCSREETWPVYLNRQSGLWSITHGGRNTGTCTLVLKECLMAAYSLFKHSLIFFSPGSTAQLSPQFKSSVHTFSFYLSRLLSKGRPHFVHI